MSWRKIFYLFIIRIFFFLLVNQRLLTYARYDIGLWLFYMKCTGDHLYDFLFFFPHSTQNLILKVYRTEIYFCDCRCYVSRCIGTSIFPFFSFECKKNATFFQRVLRCRKQLFSSVVFFCFVQPLRPVNQCTAWFLSTDQNNTLICQQSFSPQSIIWNCVFQYID